MKLPRRKFLHLAAGAAALPAADPSLSGGQTAIHEATMPLSPPARWHFSMQAGSFL